MRIPHPTRMHPRMGPLSHIVLDACATGSNQRHLLCMHALPVDMGVSIRNASVERLPRTQPCVPPVFWFRTRRTFVDPCCLRPEKSWNCHARRSFAVLTAAHADSCCILVPSYDVVCFVTMVAVCCSLMLIFCTRRSKPRSAVTSSRGLCRAPTATSWT